MHENTQTYHTCVTINNRLPYIYVTGLDKLESTSSSNRLVLEDVLWNDWHAMHDGEYRCGNITMHDPSNEDQPKAPNADSKLN